MPTYTINGGYSFRLPDGTLLQGGQTIELDEATAAKHSEKLSPSGVDNNRVLGAVLQTLDGDLVGPDGTVIMSKMSPRWGFINAAILGSSDDQHCFCNLEGTLVVVNHVGTWTSLSGDHLLQSGVLVSLNKDAPLTALQFKRTTARATRLSATTLQIPLPGWPDGTAVMDLHILSAYAQPSWVRGLVNRANGAIRIIATYAVGGEKTVAKLAQVDDAIATPGVKMIIGAGGIGNDLLDGEDPAVTIANITAIARKICGAGLIYCLRMPPATANMTTLQQASGRKIMAALEALRAELPGLLLINEYAVTINPSTGLGKAELFIGDGVHMNRIGKEAVAAQAWSTLQPLLAPPIDRLISSVTDCRSREPQNQQADDGFWMTNDVARAGSVTLSSAAVGAGVTATSSAAVFVADDVGRTIVSGAGVGVVTAFTSAASVTINITTAFASTALAAGSWSFNTTRVASTLNNKATGVVDSSITNIVVGGAGAALACSLELRADGFGYDQVFTFTPGGNNQSFQVTMTGSAGYEFWRNLSAMDYDVGCTLSIAPDTGLEISGYQHYLQTTVAGQVGRITEETRTEHGVNNEPPIKVALVSNPCLFPPARITATPTAAAWIFAINVGLRGTAGNKVVIKWGRPTIRPSPLQGP